MRADLQPVRADLRAMSVILMIAGLPGPGSGHYQAGYRARPAARYHPLGVEQEPGGLDELGRIPSERKEKETLWLT